MATFESYKTAQVFKIIQDSRTIFIALADSMGAMFLVALKLAFPILITLFVLSVTLGLLAKAAPQMNIFMLGFPIQIGVGFLIMITVIGAIALGMSSALNKSFEGLFNFIRAFSG